MDGFLAGFVAFDEDFGVVLRGLGGVAFDVGLAGDDFFHRAMGLALGGVPGDVIAFLGEGGHRGGSFELEVPTTRLGRLGFRCGARKLHTS